MIGGYHAYFHDRLIEKVTTEKIQKAVELAAGAAPDFAAYQYACGLLAGLDLALEIAEEIKKELNAA